MEILGAIGQLLNNESVAQSIAASFGAFVAFILVILNDWRRERKKVRHIRAEIEMNLSLARGKLETVCSNRDLMRESNRVIAVPIIKFNTILIRQLCADVLDHLSLDQRRSIEAICYGLEATDGILEEIRKRAELFSGAMGHADRHFTADRLLVDLADALVNLKRLIEQCENYHKGKYTIIVTKEYHRAQYEEP